MISAAAHAATGYQRTFPGTAQQVSHVRREVARHLAGCPAADEAVLIASELAANAVLHPASGGGFFTIRVELHADHARIECQDPGGPWQRRKPDDRPHGLDIVQALTGPGGWGTRTAAGGDRIVWARLSWAGGRVRGKIPAEQCAIVAANIRALRQRSGWSQARLGELMGWPTTSTVCAAEGHRAEGQRGFRAEEVTHLAAVFGVSPEQLTTRCVNCDGQPPAGYACLACGAGATPGSGRPAAPALPRPARNDHAAVSR